MESFKKIILGVDLNHFSAGPLSFASSMSVRNKAELVVIYACPDIMPLVNVLMPKDILASRKKESQKELEGLCQKHLAQEVDWEALVLEGRTVYEIIIEAARKLKPDLIIIGEHDRHKLDEIFLGTNTEKIVRYAPCSVFVSKNR